MTKDLGGEEHGIAIITREDALEDIVDLSYSSGAFVATEFYYRIESLETAKAFEGIGTILDKGVDCLFTAFVES